MKTKTLIITCLFCFIAILTSCDDIIVHEGVDKGDNDGSDPTKNPRSLSDTIMQNSNQEIADVTYKLE